MYTCHIMELFPDSRSSILKRKPASWTVSGLLCGQDLFLIGLGKGGAAAVRSMEYCPAMNVSSDWLERAVRVGGASGVLGGQRGSEALSIYSAAKQP